MKPRAPLRRRSLKRAARSAEYRAWRDSYLASHPVCELCPILVGADLRPRIVSPYRGDHRAQGVHHLWKRGQGGPDIDENVLAACHWSNGWVEDHPALAHRLGLVVRAGDPGRSPHD